MGYALQDEVEEFIVSMLDQGYTKAEIIEEIPEVFDGFDIGLASDAYEDYERDNDPANEDATVGDIERFIDEQETEGFSHDEAITRAMKRFKLSAQEIRSMTENTRYKALNHLRTMEEALDDLARSYDDLARKASTDDTEERFQKSLRALDALKAKPSAHYDKVPEEDTDWETAIDQFGPAMDDLAGEGNWEDDDYDEDEDDIEEMDYTDAVDLMITLIDDQGMDEEEAAAYVVDKHMMPANAFDSDDAAANSRNIDQRDELVADLLDLYYGE